MFKKLLASAGIGSAKVDTLLDKVEVTPGENVTGKVCIQGGRTEQQVEKINLFLMTEALRERDDKMHVEDVILQRYALTSSFTIHEGEEKAFDFAFTLPIQTPPTIGRTKVWVQTGLDIPQSIDPQDRDYLHVDTHPYMKTVLDAITQELGFHLRKVEMEYSSRYGYMQEFEFTPTDEFSADLDELEAIFLIRDYELRIFLQVDRRAKGLGGLFAEALETDESNIEISFSEEQLANGPAYISEQLRQTIINFSK